MFITSEVLQEKVTEHRKISVEQWINSLTISIRAKDSFLTSIQRGGLKKPPRSSKLAFELSKIFDRNVYDMWLEKCIQDGTFVSPVILKKKFEVDELLKKPNIKWDDGFKFSAVLANEYVLTPEEEDSIEVGINEQGVDSDMVLEQANNMVEAANSALSAINYRLSLCGVATQLNMYFVTEL